jgi:hypothetical protein
MKRILTTLSENWPQYILESIVIIASILLAIWLENWNESRIERQKETKYLKAIISDLEVDRSDLVWNRDFTKEKWTSNSRLLSLVREERPMYDSFNYDLANILTPVHFLSNTSGYEAILNAGIEIIGNDSLRSAIVFHYEWYEKHLQFFEANDDHVVQYQILWPIYLKHVKLHEYWKDAEPIDAKDILVNPEFYNVLTTNKFYREYMLAQYQEGNERAEKLEMAIKNYLDKL